MRSSSHHLLMPFVEAMPPALADEFVTLADEIEGASFWKAQAMS
jgi:hypothetical protein